MCIRDRPRAAPLRRSVPCVATLPDLEAFGAAFRGGVGARAAADVGAVARALAALRAARDALDGAVSAGEAAVRAEGPIIAWDLDKRRAYLAQHCGFRCVCARCLLEEEQAARSSR